MSSLKHDLKQLLSNKEVVLNNDLIRLQTENPVLSLFQFTL